MPNHDDAKTIHPLTNEQHIMTSVPVNFFLFFAHAGHKSTNMKRPEKFQIRHHRNHSRVSSLTVGNHLACYGFHHCKRRFPQGSTRSCSLKHQRQVAYFFLLFMLLRRGAFLTCNLSRCEGVLPLRKTVKFCRLKSNLSEPHLGLIVTKWPRCHIRKTPLRRRFIADLRALRARRFIERRRFAMVGEFVWF